MLHAHVLYKEGEFIDMEHLTIPEGYSSPLTIRETEVAIKEIKDHFEHALAKHSHYDFFYIPVTGDKR